MHKSYIYEHFFDKFIIFCLFSFKYRKIHFSLYLSILWHIVAYSISVFPAAYRAFCIKNFYIF